MIYIISVFLMICLLLGSILVAAMPNLESLMRKDFDSRAAYYSKLAGLRYGDLVLRAKNVIPAPYDAVPQPGNMTSIDLEWLTTINGNPESTIVCNVTFSYLSTGESTMLVEVQQN